MSIKFSYTLNKGSILLEKRAPRRRNTSAMKTDQTRMKKTLLRPRRDCITTQEMLDSNLSKPGYRYKKTFFHARTAGIFWGGVKTRDYRQFTGSPKKTLHGTSLECDLARETDPLQWPGVRPSNCDPG